MKIPRLLKHLGAGLTGIFLLSISLPALDAAESRTWTDANGRTVEAEYIGIKGAGATAAVKMRLADGKEIDFPVANLSKEDQLFVGRNLPKDPAVLAASIDKLVLEKMKSSYYELRDELTALPANENMSAADKNKRAAEIKNEMVMCAPNERTSDEQFMRRIYLDVAGRIPTFQEATDFLESNSRTKRAELIDDLLASDAYAMHMFNFWSDLLRVREQIVMGGGGQLKVDPYVEWIKEAMKSDMPYNEFVSKMMTATGRVWDDPAAGYLITDNGMKLCNVSNTFTIFLGTEITCAQCHDHPFEDVMQADFFKMASFFGGTQTRSRGGGMMAMSNPREEEKRLQKLLKDGGKLRPNQETDNQLGNILGSYSYAVTESDKNDVELPHDYKYDDYKPNQTLEPATYMGDIVDLEKFDSPRAAFADWLTSEDNPRFTVNIVNRLWKQAFGLAQIEPVYNIPGHLDGQAQNYDLLIFLEKMMADLDYSIQDFMRVLYNTEAYQREAETLSPTLTQIDKGTYHFPGPVLRRMTAEQMWDSLVTLTTPDPEAMIRRGADRYREIMNQNLSELVTADDVMKFKADFNAAGGLTDESGEMMGSDAMNAARVGGETMARASEMAIPQRADHFLRMFGQSDKQLIENQFTTGSSPQVMALLNGKITNSVLTDKDSYLINEIANGTRGKGDKIEKLFVSILGRYPTTEEKTAAASGLRARKSDGPEAELDALADVVWALVNTREFMFIQ